MSFNMAPPVRGDVCSIGRVRNNIDQYLHQSLNAIGGKEITGLPVRYQLPVSADVGRDNGL